MSTPDPDLTASARAAGRRRRSRLLECGELSIEGRLVDASNATLYCAVTGDGVTRRVRLQAGRGGAAAVGLPRRHAGRARGRGLRGVGRDRLGHRAADRATATGRPGRAWCSCGSTPTTTPTSVALIRAPGQRRSCAAIAVFDAVINNADRKGGHLLPTPAGHVYGVDHGVSFHVEDKLRTVLWQWAGAALPDEALDVLRRLRARARRRARRDGSASC